MFFNVAKNTNTMKHQINSTKLKSEFFNKTKTNEVNMNKLLSTPLAVAVSAAFVMTVSLSSCATNPAQEKTASNQQNLSPEEAARVAAEKKRAADQKRARAVQGPQAPSGGCGH